MDRTRIWVGVILLSIMSAFVAVWSGPRASTYRGFLRSTSTRSGANGNVGSKWQHPRMMATTVDAEKGAMAANKMLHVVYRVGDIAKTKEFYQKNFGMKVLRERDVPEEKYTNCFLGYGPEQRGEHFSIELTFNYGVTTYDTGDGVSHFGIYTPDVPAAMEKIRANGGNITGEAAPVKGLGIDLMTGFVNDPDGYRFELTDHPKRRDPMMSVAFRVSDLDKSVAFYRDGLGMRQVARMDLPEQKCTQVQFTYGDSDDATTIQLIYEYDHGAYNIGDGYGQVAVSTPDVYKAAEHIKAAGYEVTRAPGPVPGIGTKITAVRDPDGYKVVLVDAEDFEREFL